jgi:hypothetical protein
MGQSLENDVFALQKQVASLQRQVHELNELVSVLATPPWKRLWFFLCGWRLYAVGRWYRSEG